jgi:hypothetical protein
MKYNKEKHLYLLKYSQKLESEGKHIYDESEKDFFALREYSVMLINHLHWENRQQYFELIEQLLNGPVEFLKLRKKHRSVNDAGKLLQGELILLEPNEKSEEELKKLIQKIFIEMKDRYP